MFKQFNFKLNYNNTGCSYIHFPVEYKKIITEMPKEVFKIAGNSIIEKKRKIWIDHNDLKVTGLLYSMIWETN